jgi:hypothetical protein
MEVKQITLGSALFMYTGCSNQARRGPLLMLCPECLGLHHDHCRECEVEADATLRWRSHSLCGSHAKTTPSGEDLSDLVLASRKRQLSITLRMELHKAAAHAA